MKNLGKNNLRLSLYKKKLSLHNRRQEVSLWNGVIEQALKIPYAMLVNKAKGPVKHPFEPLLLNTSEESKSKPWMWGAGIAITGVLLAKKWLSKKS